ncbi:MAG: hypothetical protein H6610_10820, partial [Ignavibacteriales bacterium]|nr:hypothetical protein [Ignavibacteriales bacterium]
MKIRELFIVIIFLSFTALAQTDENQKNIKGVKIVEENIGNVSIKNSEGQKILEIIDETDDVNFGASIKLPSLNSIGDYSNKLYNLGNTLYWNDTQLLGSSQNASWISENSSTYLLHPTNLIGIGTNAPQQKLHVESGSILVNGHTNWFPGLTIKNDVGRSVLNLQGKTNTSNFRSSEILLTDLENGNSWSILNTNTYEFNLVNHKNGNDYLTPLKIEFGAPTNSLIINRNGNVGIGALSDEHQLAVAGSIISEEVVVKLKENWPDYVFSPDYYLPSLTEQEEFIKTNNHLMEIPNEEEISE